MKKIKYQAVCKSCPFRSYLFIPKTETQKSDIAAATMAYLMADVHGKKYGHSVQVEQWKELEDVA